MPAPEIILDRWVRKQSQECPLFAGYLGKLDLDTVEPPSFSSFLRFVQNTMNRALQLENANASGGNLHPPYHFDYLQVDYLRVKGRPENAYAFEHEGFSFIAITLPLVQLLWDLSFRVSRSAVVQGLLHIDSATTRLDALQALLFQFHLTFLVSHEYTHHVHRHCSRVGDGIWTEFLQNEAIGGLDSQAHELDADGYAIYLVLANFVRGATRQGAIAQLGGQDLPSTEADDLLLMCFFVALAALFCALWPDNIQTESIYELTHPPAPVRIEYSIRVAKMWCEQNGSLPESWFSGERFNALFRAATEWIQGSAPPAWDTHIEFLQNAAGAEYDSLSLERFEAIRKRPAESVVTAIAHA